MNSRKDRPTIQQVKEIDIVSFLANLGFKPQRISRHEHWYISPLRISERTASFKVDQRKNLWYDHGLGKGGDLITFAQEFYRCSISEFLDSLAGSTILVAPPSVPPGKIIAPDDPEHSGVTIIKICAIKESGLINYLRQRRIPLHIADRFCKEIHYRVKDREYYGIGFENDKGGYEIRTPYVKISTHPKAIRTISNGGNSVYVFEGFMDFLSFVTLQPEQVDFPRDFVILNSVNQFEKARLFMEQHILIHMFLDHDSAGRSFTSYGLSISDKYTDESKMYSGYKDMNDWHVHFGKKSKLGLG